MNELIKINYHSERPTVLGRDLYEALEVKTAYRIGFLECVNMDLKKMLTIAHF